MARRKDVSKPQILDAAQVLLVRSGFNGFSTRLLADEIGISSASLHHHFVTKGDLAAAVIARYRDSVNSRMAEVARDIEGFSLRLRHVEESVGADSMLLAMLAADFPVLPLPAQNEARQLFTNVLGWLTRLAIQARSEGELPEDSQVDGIAASVLSSLIGRALLARTDLPPTTAMPSSTWAWQR